MREVLDDLFLAQKELDLKIQEQHDASYEKTLHQRVLAFFVELGEMANETRCFKYWSFKGPSPKEVILEEWADGLHFLLSLGVAMKVTSYTHEMRKEECTLVDQILKCYVLTSDYLIDFDPKKYALLFSAYLNILPLLNSDFKEGKEAYFHKLAINYERQKEGY